MNVVDKIGVFLDKGEVDKALLDSFSKRLRVTFPITYINMLSKHNQLYPEKNIFDFKENSTNDERDIVFLGFGKDANENIEDINCDDYGYKGVVVFGRSANGDYIGFDYRETPDSSEPEIVLMYHDEYILDESGNPKMLITKISDNFDSFINMLHE